MGQDRRQEGGGDKMKGPEGRRRDNRENVRIKGRKRERKNEGDKKQERM